MKNYKRPIRMRGYYRALKRKEKWATSIEKLKDKDQVGYLFAMAWKNLDLSNEPTESLFGCSAKGIKGWQGGTIPVPLFASSLKDPVTHSGGDPLSDTVLSNTSDGTTEHGSDS